MMIFGFVGTMTFNMPTVEAANVRDGQTTVNLNMRQGAGTNHRIIRTLPKGTKLKILSERNGWMKVRVGKQEGFVSAKFVRVITAAPKPPANSSSTKVRDGQTTANLNMRRGAGTNHSVIRTLPKGTKLKILSERNGWMKVRVGKQEGFVSAKFVRVITAAPKPAPPTPKPTPPAPKPPAPPSVTLKSISEVQQRLRNLSYLGADGRALTVSGSANVNTFYAIREFQKQHNLTANGQAGQATQNILFSTQAKKSAGTATKPLVGNGYQFLDIRYPSQVTAAEINNYITAYERTTGRKSGFAGQGQSFINVARSAGINEVIFVAMAIHESAYGTNPLTTHKNNIFSVAAYDSAPFDSAYTFSSIQQALEYQAQFLRTGYMNPNNFRFKGFDLGNAQGGFNFYYATDANWGSKIAAHAQRIRPFRATEYNNRTIMTGRTPSVTLPQTYDDFSQLGRDIMAVTTGPLPLRSSYSGTTVVRTLPRGTDFKVLGKYNNHTFKIEHAGVVYYTNINLSNYRQFFTINNLIRSNTTFRYAAQTGATVPAGHVGVYR